MNKRSEAANLKKYDDTVAKLREGWKDYLSSGVDFFLELQKVETDGVWKFGGHQDFREFLKREFPNTLGFDRYQNVIRAIEEWGVEFVREVGIDSAYAITPKWATPVLTSPKKKAEVEAQVRVHIKRDGCSPGPAKIRDILRQVAPETRRVTPERKAVLQAEKEITEVETLRARVKELEHENAVLKHENAKLKKLIARDKAA